MVTFADITCLLNFKKNLFKVEGVTFLTQYTNQVKKNGSAQIHVATVKNVFVESSDRKKNWLRNPLTNSGVESNDKKNKLSAESITNRGIQ